VTYDAGLLQQVRQLQAENEKITEELRLERERRMDLEKQLLGEIKKREDLARQLEAERKKSRGSSKLSVKQPSKINLIKGSKLNLLANNYSGQSKLGSKLNVLAERKEPKLNGISETDETNGGSKLNLGVPPKLILPEGPAPKFWLQTCQPVSDTRTVFSLAEILEGILRPFREDEIWGLANQIAVKLGPTHKQGKVHGNIFLGSVGLNVDGTVTIIETKEMAPPKFIPPENLPKKRLSYDIFGLGAVLWSTGDYLLDEDEEPSIGEELCELILEMASDDPSERPHLGILLERTSKYTNVSQNLLREIMQEVSRKRDLRSQYEKGVVTNQSQMIRSLLNEIQGGITLRKRVPPEERLRSMSEASLQEIQKGKVKLLRVI